MNALSRQETKESEPPATPDHKDAVCDLSVMCPYCGIDMDQEHAHMRCSSCGYRDSCCF